MALQIHKLEAALEYTIDDLKSLKKWPISGGKEKGEVIPLAFLLIWKDFHLNFFNDIFNCLKLFSRSLENGPFYYYLLLLQYSVTCTGLPLGLPPTLHTD